jgi:hypothetical protein
MICFYSYLDAKIPINAFLNAISEVRVAEKHA